MSIERRPRQLGVIVHCDGTDVDYCKATIATANCRADANRSYAKSQGWGRGLRKGRKRNDLCPKCFAIESELFKDWKAANEKYKAERRARLKAATSAEPRPKKSRKKTETPSIPASSPSADCAPALAT